ncbi:MAG: hypothetical protein A2066_00775 [Bacteroidetes bacterium GWB2_41_8]|nr:MAG: hypothetical protein A2066_00775 [Bacteroidetes bacterium GWB2_41_8]
MTLDELKLYLVRVKDGSGCLFQPILNEDNFTYILTAKHLFEGSRPNENGEDTPYSDLDGTEIKIIRQINLNGKWQDVIIPFVLTRGETYFPHKDADASILKVSPLLPGFDKIISIELPIKINSYSLYGFPKQYEGNPIGNKDTDYRIREAGLPAQYLQNAQLTNDTLNLPQIEGMSGGGILSIQNENIYIIGIQSEVKHAVWASGKICFVPMKYFVEIINYEEFNSKLTKLHPPFVGKFDFLRDDAFELKVDAWDENKVESTRIHLRNKALDVMQLGITPVGIKELFKNRLLIDETESHCLDTKNIWIGWLEFLTIFNIVKEENITPQQLSDVFNNVRLKYTHVEDCTTLFQDHLSKSDYIGLKPRGTVIINSKNAPRKPFRVPIGGMINNIRIPQDKRGFRTDLGIDPFQSFSFVHLDYFKTECIINKLEEYQNLSEEQLFAKLKQEYDELFN